MEDIRERLRSYLETVVLETGAELVKLGFYARGQQLDIRVLLNKDGGIRLDECAAVNKRLRRFIDEESLISGAYTIEVSSPGLDRELTTEKDFSALCQKKVRFWLKESRNDKREWTGKIVRVQDGLVYVEIPPDKKGHPAEEIAIEIENINKAKLEIGW